MERSVSLSSELEAIGSPRCAKLETIESPKRSKSAEPKSTYDGSGSDSETEEPETSVAIQAVDEDSCLVPETPFASPSVARSCCILCHCFCLWYLAYPTN